MSLVKSIDCSSRGLGYIPSTHMMAHNCLQFQSQGIQCLLPVCLHGHCMHVAHRHTCRQTPTRIKKIIKNMLNTVRQFFYFHISLHSLSKSRPATQQEPEPALSHPWGTARISRIRMCFLLLHRRLSKQVRSFTLCCKTHGPKEWNSGV